MLVHLWSLATRPALGACDSVFLATHSHGTVLESVTDSPTASISVKIYQLVFVVRSQTNLLVILGPEIETASSK